MSSGRPVTEVSQVSPHSGPTRGLLQAFGRPGMPGMSYELDDSKSTLSRFLIDLMPSKATTSACFFWIGALESKVVQFLHKSYPMYPGIPFMILYMFPTIPTTGGYHGCFIGLMA